jgi:hypothetical protein
MSLKSEEYSFHAEQLVEPPNEVKPTFLAPVGFANSSDVIDSMGNEQVCSEHPVQTGPFCVDVCLQLSHRRLEDCAQVLPIIRAGLFQCRVKAWLLKFCR